jgi:hypothetical protein
MSLRIASHAHLAATMRHGARDARRVSVSFGIMDDNPNSYLGLLGGVRGVSGNAAESYPKAIAIEAPTILSVRACMSARAIAT